MDAVDLHPLALPCTDTALGTDADAWFMALDGRPVRIGDDTGVIRVDGIHGAGPTLWIQVQLFDDAAAGVVLQVDETHSPEDVIATLSRYTLSGRPLEIIRVRSTPAEGSAGDPETRS